MMTREQRKVWDGMIRQSFHPSQWYYEDDLGITEDKLMWVYKPMEQSPRYEVGYWTPEKQWVIDSKGLTKEAAAQRVHFLNGGNR